MIKKLLANLKYRHAALWIFWLILTSILAIYLVNALIHDKQRLFLSGKTSNGHYQIEQKCELCHTRFEGVNDNACLKCHESELKKANDSHKIKKFNDPRNAPLLDIIDAKRCVTCHREHQPEMTLPIGVTQPRDFCVRCHADVAKDRPTHQGLKFDTCSDCHNYHDNRALYEDFLAKHLHEDKMLNKTLLPARNFLTFYTMNATHSIEPLTIAQQDAPAQVNLEQAKDWEHSSHAKAGVNCMMCHSQDKQTWVAKPDASFCSSCHDDQVKGFLAGKHGMRLANQLPAMTTGKARLTMKKDEPAKSPSCTSCHTAHSFATTPIEAGVNACLGCHADEHSLAYKKSAHFQLVQQAHLGHSDQNAGVSCASCHLPRESSRFKGKERVKVQHNQNDNLRPNAKMVRDVCLRCHGLDFTLDALADKALIKNNFTGQPKQHLPSLDMVEKRTQTNKPSVTEPPN